MRRKWRARLTLEATPAVTVGVLLYWNVFPLFVELSLLFALFSLVVWTELVLIITGAYANLPKSWEWKVEKQVKTLNSIPTVGWFFETISNRVEKHRTVANRQEQYDTANRIMDDYVEIVGDELDRELEFSPKKRAELVERIVADTEQRKVNAYPILTEELLSGTFDKNRKAVEALIFAVEQERLASSDRDLSYTGEQLSNFRQGVANAFEQLDFSGDGQAKCNLTALYAEHWSATPQGDDLDEMTDAQVYEAFVGQYYPHKEYPAYESDEEEVNYKSEIVRLVQSELSIGNIQTDLLERLQTERERIKSHVRSHEGYFVCAKKIGDDASFYDEFGEKFPRRIRIGNKYINEPTRDEEPLEIWMRIVFPEETYGSAENFREQALADIISDGVMVFVSEVNLPFETHRSEDELAVIADEPENVRYALTETDLLLTGHSEEEITQRALDNLAVVNEDVEKILAALSLRSLVPHATSKEEEVFERNRPIVEDDLGITRIFDWRTRDVDEVSVALQDVDERNVSDRWEEIARHLIQRVDAATPPEYKEGNQAEARPEPTD